MLWQITLPSYLEQVKVSVYVLSVHKGGSWIFFYGGVQEANEEVKGGDFHTDQKLVGIYF